jgi:N-acylglucosamine 2-epimerase/mannose-6-phosphate isomerase
VYVYAHAHALGYPNGRARAGVQWMVRHAWRGPDRGWARLLAPDGRVLDANADLYDHAFALLALAWTHRVDGDAGSLAWARRTLEVIERRFRHPRVGFLHALAPEPAGWRLQNPHMHLLEACHALWEAAREPRAAELACELASIGAQRFFDPRTGTLGEHFTDGLRRAPGPDGRRVEPGHQFEWAWLLARHRALFGERHDDVVRALVGFGERHGVDAATGLVYDAVHDDGAPLDRRSRTWPNTERVKGHVALWDTDGTDPRPGMEAAMRALLDRYLTGVAPGAWWDRMDGEGRCVAPYVPASTFYHLFLAITEAERAAVAVEAFRSALPLGPLAPIGSACRSATGARRAA